MSDSEGYSEGMDVDGNEEEELKSDFIANLDSKIIDEIQEDQKTSHDTSGKKESISKPDVVPKVSTLSRPNAEHSRRDNNENVMARINRSILLPDVGNLFVMEPKIELDNYVQQFSGYARLLRLAYIEKVSPPLRIEALGYMLQYLQETHNTKLFEHYRKVLENEQPSRLTNADNAKEWAIHQDKKSLAKLHKLDDDFRIAKNSSNKESIWRISNELGDHHMDCGDLQNAAKNYCQAKDYCSSGKELIRTCMNVVKISTFLGNWTHVASWSNKALSSPEFEKRNQVNYSKAQITDLQLVQTQMQCALGLAELMSSNFRKAALRFLECSLDNCSNDLISQQNVATYTGLCAMATFTRNEMHQKIIKSPSFKSFLELDPTLRQILTDFNASKYGQSLKALEEMRETLLCDVYLSRHVECLFDKIRKKAMVQYFSPYSSADLNMMATAFNVSVPRLEDELMSLILDGQLQAKIDSHNRVLISQNVDKRNEVYERVVQMSQEYERKEKMLLFRSAVVRNEIEIKSIHRFSDRFAGDGGMYD